MGDRVKGLSLWSGRFEQVDAARDPQRVERSVLNGGFPVFIGHIGTWKTNKGFAGLESAEGRHLLRFSGRDCEGLGERLDVLVSDDQGRFFAR